MFRVCFKYAIWRNFMSIIADIRALRGVMIVSTDDGQSLRVRVADFKKMPVESGDEIDFDAYSDLSLIYI